MLNKPTSNIKYNCNSLRFKHWKRHQKPVIFKCRVLFIGYFSHLFLYIKLSLGIKPYIMSPSAWVATNSVWRQPGGCIVFMITYILRPSYFCNAWDLNPLCAVYWVVSHWFKINSPDDYVSIKLWVAYLSYFLNHRFYIVLQFEHSAEVLKNDP